MKNARNKLINWFALTACTTTLLGGAAAMKEYLRSQAENSSSVTTFEMAGASIRYTRDRENGTKGDGIRFGVVLDNSSYNSFVDSAYELGILVIPKRLLAENASLTISTDKVGKMVTYSASENINEWKSYTETSDCMISYGYVWNVPSDYYNDDFIACGYAKASDDSVIYTTPIERSIDYVAFEAKKDLTNDLAAATGEEKAAIESKIAQLGGYLEANTYTVTYKALDGTVLDTQSGTYGEDLSFDGTIPEKAASEVFSYSFKEWRTSANDGVAIDHITGTMDVYTGYTTSFREDKMLISYMTEFRPDSDAGFDILEESGINCVFSWSYSKSREAYLDSRGLAYMPYLNYMTPQEVLANANVDSFGDCVVGFQYVDEPDYDDLESLKALAKNHAENYPEKIFYVNLHPCHFNEEGKADGLYGGYTYDQYVAKYCENVFQYITTNRFLSVDIYPLLNDGTLNENWLYTYEVLSKYAKQYNAKLHFYVSTMEHNYYRKTDLDNLRYTVNVAMTYGAKALSYFTYAQFESETTLKGLVSGDGLTTNEEYTYAQTVNKELLHWDSIFQKYTWQSVMTVLGSSSENNANYSHLKLNVSSLDGLSSVTATQDTLIGSFTGNNSEKAFMVSNFSDPINNYTDTVTLNLSNANKVAVFENGKYSIQTLTNGALTLNLTAGRAAFVIVSDNFDFGYHTVTIEGTDYTVEKGDVVKVEPKEDKPVISWSLNGEFYTDKSSFRYEVGDTDVAFTAKYAEEYITVNSGCSLSYDAAFTYGEEEYSTKLTGTGWTMAIKLSGEQVSESEYDYVVFRIYTTDFKCTCGGGHEGTQALRNLPTTSYSSGTVSLKDQAWTEIVLKASDYNQLISDGTTLQINNSCTAAGKEVWISQPQAVKSTSWFTGGTQSVSLANSYNGKATTSVKVNSWNVAIYPTEKTEKTSGNMVFYVKTDNYAKGYDSKHAVKIGGEWYSSAIVVGEWIRVTIPVDVWNTLGDSKKISIDDSQNISGVVYYISEVTWEAVYVTVNSGCSLSYDTEFTYGEEEYSTKLTGTAWTMAIKLSGEQVSESEYDYVVFRIYTTDFKCTCGSGHEGTQALRNLPTTSYSAGAVSLKDQAWTVIVLKASDYNQLISDGTTLQINNSCTAAGKEVWISQPQAVKSYVTPVAGLAMEASSEAQYNFGQEYAIKLSPKSWTTTFVFTDQGLPEAAAYKFSAIVNGMGGNSALAIYYCPNSDWNNRVKLCEFTEKDQREDVVLSKAQYQALLNGTADLEYCVKDYAGSVSLSTCLYISEVTCEE